MMKNKEWINPKEELTPIVTRHTTNSNKAPGDFKSKYGTCNSLPTWTDGSQHISTWKLSLWSRVKILFTGKLWLSILSKSHPPVSLMTKSPFKRLTTRVTPIIASHETRNDHRPTD